MPKLKQKHNSKNIPVKKKLAEKKKLTREQGRVSRDLASLFPNKRDVNCLRRTECKNYFLEG